MLAASPFYDATHFSTCSLVASINTARSKWKNSRKNILPLKLCNIILGVKCYVTYNVTAATVNKKRPLQIFHEVSDIFQQNSNDPKNSAVLESRTGQFSRT